MSLHTVLMQTDGSHPSITQGASMMMRHYDRSAGTAVTEWRNALQSCQPHQLLPLLYVANEVLQNSKRNRGNKFLEAFAPILGQGLQLICQRDGELVEKVRRTAKIWGDRRVFSVRFVSELLKGLEPYRGGGGGGGGGGANDMESQRFSPPQQDHLQESRPPAQTKSPESSAEVTTSPTADDLMRDDPEDDDDDGDIHGMNHDDDDDDDDQDSLGFNTSGEGQLDVTIDADALLAVDNDENNNNMTGGRRMSMKRRRSSTGSTGGGGRKRRTVLSTQSLQDLWNQLSSLQKSYDQSQTALQGIPPQFFTSEGVNDLVGEELLDAYRKVRHYQKMVESTERRNLHRIANSKHQLELEALRYLPWLESALAHDDQEIEFCDRMQTQLQRIRYVHGVAKQARDERKQKEAVARAKQAEERRIQQETAAREAALQQALTRQEEAKPGMVWNKALQEYVYLNTNEDWRD